MECGRVNATANFQGTKDSSLTQGGKTVAREKWRDSSNIYKQKWQELLRNRMLGEGVSEENGGLRLTLGFLA